MSAATEKIVSDFCAAWPRKNIDEMIKLDADYAVFAIFSPYPGTESFEDGETRSIRESARFDDTSNAGVKKTSSKLSVREKNGRVSVRDGDQAFLAIFDLLGLIRDGIGR